MHTINMYLGIFLMPNKVCYNNSFEKSIPVTLHVFSLLKHSCYFPGSPGSAIRDGNKTPPAVGREA